MPSPRKNERKKDFVERCMSDSESRRDFPNRQQRFAFCNSQFERKRKAQDQGRLYFNYCPYLNIDISDGGQPEIIVRKSSSVGYSSYTP